jgi:uncharacterized membrane protein YeaQ/YmgE (transglycosylase-associated protein family)
LFAIDAYGWTSDSLLNHSTLNHSTTEQEKIMSFVMWLGLGLAAGLVGSRLGNRKADGSLPDIVLGVVGAIAGGWLFYMFGPPAVNGFHLLSLYAAFIGSLAFLLVYRARRLF